MTTKTYKSYSNLRMSDYFHWVEKQRPLSFSIQPLTYKQVDNNLKVTKGEFFRLEESDIFDMLPQNINNIYSWVCLKVKRYLEQKEGPDSQNHYLIIVNTNNKKEAASQVVRLNQPDLCDGALYQ